MRPDSEIEAEEADNPEPVTGDVIGNTAYSERFVLKILIKFASKDTLKNELQEESFEEELCTLWDMTAERDVVMYLQTHDVLDLLTFAMPVIESPRLNEIMIGIIGNMCCHREVAEIVAAKNDLLELLFERLKSDDSQILNQLIRLISSCVFLAEEADIGVWMSKFNESGYAEILYFILKNSTNKDLLMTALENLNTLGAQCNTDEYTQDFLRMFVRSDAIDALYAGFREVTKHLVYEDDKSRMKVITVQIVIHLVRFKESPEVFTLNKDSALQILRDILSSYEHSVTVLKQIDRDLVDILDSADAIVDVLKLSEISNLDNYFNPCYKMWTAAFLIRCENGADKEEDEVKKFFINLRPAVSTLMCTYMSQCSDDNLIKALDTISDNYDNITNDITNVNLKNKIVNRSANYRNRINDYTDS